MTQTRGFALARAVGVFAVLVSIAGNVAFAVIEDNAGGEATAAGSIGDFFLALAFVLFPVAGAVILWRQPGNAVGWVYCSVGLLVGTGGTAQAYAVEAIPNGRLGWLEYTSAWFANWWWYPLLALVTVGVVYLFPTGRLLSPRWRFLFWPGVIGITVVTLFAMTAPTLETTVEGSERILYRIDNPVGIGGVVDPEEGGVGGVGFGLLLLSMLGGAVQIIVRFVRSRGVERQQMKWFAFACMLIPLNVVVEELLPQWLVTSDVLFALALCALPVSTGIAVVRYRLYEIDVVINRALVYGTLTAVLGAVYVGIVFALQQVLSPVTTRNDLAIAGSTLAVAGLFGPVRRRVQTFIDRRFYRRKVDAQRTIEEFNSHLRDEVELTTVTSQLVDVVRETMQPAHVGLWLRDAGASR